MVSPSLEKTGTLGREHSGALESARTRGSVWSAWLERDQVIAVYFAFTACVIHFLFNGGYGYFRDELYYAACGQHLAWGYVDQAPLIAVIARLSRMMFGDSLRALRFFPALASGAKILLTGWIVRELGGRRFAQVLAGTAMLLCPIYLTMDNFLSMNAFEPVLWMLCVAIALRIIRTGQQQLWVLFGLVAGIGILNKHSTLLFGFGFFLALLVTPQRRLLQSVWIWAGALLAFAMFLPNLFWEIKNHWPTPEILRNVDQYKNAHVSWLGFIGQQALLIHPLATPICLAGLWYFLCSRKGREYRLLGWTYLFILLQLLIFRGRIYYLAPAYPMLFAAGAVAIESWVENRARAPLGACQDGVRAPLGACQNKVRAPLGQNWNWIKTVILAPLAVGGLVAAPLAMPILPLDTAASYANFWDVNRVRVEVQPSGKLPQFFADMMGWQQQVAAVADVFHSLTAADQSKTAILARNYGQAGAIEYFGPSYGLPRPISGHNNYYLWGPQQYTGEIVVTVGIPLDKLQPLFNHIELATTIQNEYAIPEENNLPVYICREPKLTLQQAWPSLKFYG
ncbi:MAG: glycosyl transferase, family 39 [Candidatus Acidoferrum typicum]|nr:glycosyl transferase, family 39 [Candidatus Acidoferrum typicum]